MQLNKITKLMNDSRLVGTTDTINPFTRFNSASRSQMAASQVQQAVVPFQSDIPRCLTGFEEQVAEYTIMEKMPCDAVIVDIVHKFTPGESLGSIKENPLVTIIFQNQDNGEYDALDLETYFKAHEPFGMQMHTTNEAKHLFKGKYLNKGTVLSHTSNVKQGIYSTGLDLQVAYMSHTAATEDGFMINEEALARGCPIAMTNRSGSWGDSRYPIDAYGKGDRYVPVALPGESIRGDNLIMATRQYDEWLDGILMLPEELKRVDVVHDECVYAPPEVVNGKVTDIRIICTQGDNCRVAKTPPKMTEVLRASVGQQSRYYDRLIEVYDLLRKNEGKRPNITPRFERLMVEALADKPTHPNRLFRGMDQSKGSVQKTYKADPLDEWYVEVTVAWRYQLDYGAKLSDYHGCKGVACHIVPAWMMPRDEFGNVADVAIFERSVTARMNPGQLYEQYLNAASRDVSKRVRVMMDAGNFDQAWTYLMGYYELASPDTYEIFLRTKGTAEAKRGHLDCVYKDGIYLYIRPDSAHINPMTMHKLRQSYRPDKSRLTYIGYDGRTHTTQTPILIGSKNMIILDKSSFKPMAVSIARVQHHGLPTTTNKATKVASGSNRQAARAFGESEGRALTAAIGAEAVYDLQDVSVNPEIAEAVTQDLFMAQQPMMLEKLVDRTRFPRGRGRNVQYIQLFTNVMGAKIAPNKVA